MTATAPDPTTMSLTQTTRYLLHKDTRSISRLPIPRKKVRGAWLYRIRDVNAYVETTKQYGSEALRRLPKEEASRLRAEVGEIRRKARAKVRRAWARINASSE